MLLDTLNRNSARRPPISSHAAPSFHFNRLALKGWVICDPTRYNWDGLGLRVFPEIGFVPSN